MDKKNHSTTRSGQKIVKISKTMIGRLALVTVVVNLILLICVSSIARSSIAKQETNYVGEIVNNISTTIGTTLEEYAAISDVVSLNPEIIELVEKSSVSNPMQNQSLAASVEAYTKSVQTKYPNILNIGVCSVAQDAYFMHDGSVSGSNWSFPNRAYYSVVTTKQSTITDPYIDDATSALVVTLASPIISSNGTAIGGIFVDLSIDFIVDLVGQSGFGETGKSLIADTSGNLVACMDYEHIGSSYANLGVSGSELEREIQSTTGTLFELETNGNTSVGVVGGIAGTNWVLVTSIEKWEFDSSADQLQAILLILLVVCVTITLVVAVTTVHSSIKPIEYLRDAMYELSTGNTRYQFDYSSNNEIGAMAEDLRFATNNLGNYIEEINRQLASCSNGDFTVQSDMEFLGDFAAIQTSIRTFVQLISGALNDIKATVEQVSVGSDYVATGAQSLAEGSEKQSLSISDLNQFISSITEQITENTQSVTDVNNTAQNIAGELKSSNEQMDEMMEAMADIQEKSDGITKIVKTIEDVAFQTNILALNAAVEAARAGTAGRGFAVVAEEVRNLSSRTSEAVKNTTMLISDTTDAIKRGSAVATSTTDNLKIITEEITGFISTLDEISVASQDQAKAIEKISTGVHEISEVMKSNQKVSGDSAATSEELSSQTLVMKDAIDQFKLD